MKDYLTISYNKNKKPFTAYPQQMVKYLISKFSIQKGKKLLDIGCGRCEFLNAFIENGIDGYGLDSCDSAKTYDKYSKVKLESIGDKPLSFEDETFDVIYSKSVIEHFPSANVFMDEVLRLLKPGGLLITMTPDWETSYKLFYDDLTHYRPYTIISLSSLYAYNNLKNINVEQFIQLPCTWNSPLFRRLADVASLFASARTEVKFLKWSKYRMLLASGYK